MKEKIIIPNIEYLTDDQYDEVIEILDSLPLDYEIWKTKKFTK